MATFSHTSGVSDVSQPTWSQSTGVSDISQPTWSQGNFSQTLGEVAASWYSFESVALGFIFWEGFDDSDNNWEDMSTSPLHPFAALNWEDMG